MDSDRWSSFGLDDWLCGRPGRRQPQKDDNGQVVGHLIGKLVGPDPIRLARCAVLESIRIEPATRGRGAGSRLVAAFFAWARAHDARYASVTAFAANDGAQRFYRRHGFTPSSVTMRTAL
jgi:GNAT superfamily N-acetyltransferase